MAGNFEWHAQPGNLAANTKIGKFEKVNPNDQCLAPIRRFDSSRTISAWHRFADLIPVDSWRFWDARTAWEDCGKYEDRED
jgi:hypothetical protein